MALMQITCNIQVPIALSYLGFFPFSFTNLSQRISILYNFFLHHEHTFLLFLSALVHSLIGSPHFSLLSLNNHPPLPLSSLSGK